MNIIKLAAVSILVSLATSYWATPVYSQRTETVVFDKVVLVDSYSYYNRLRVIDYRADKEFVGTRVNQMGRRTDLITPKPIDTMLSLLFVQMLRLPNRSIGKRELLFILDDIMMEESTPGNYFPTIKFAGDFYSGEKAMYQHLGRVDTFCMLKPGKKNQWIDVIGIGKNIVTSTIAAFAAMPLPENGPVYTNEELLQNKRNERMSFPIYRDAPAFKKGVYYTVEQFLNNDPVDTPLVIKEYNPTGEARQLYAYYVTGNRGKKAVHLNGTEFFAAYNGEIWVSATYKGYSKMEFLNGEFYATKPYLHKVPVDYTGFIAGMGGMYGALGGLISGLAVAAIPPSKKVEDALIYFRSRFDPLKKDFIPIKHPR